MTLGKSTPPPTPWQSPPGFSVTMEDSGPPSLSPTPEESSTVFFCRMANLSLYLFPAPCPPPLPLPLRMLPQRWRPMWRLRRPLHPLDRFPRRFPPVPLSLVLASLRPPLPPLRSRPPPPTLTPPSPLLSTRRFRMRSPTCMAHPCINLPLRRRRVFSLAGPPLLFFSRSKLSPSSL